jgi:hypothetical protein
MPDLKTKKPRTTDMVTNRKPESGPILHDDLLVHRITSFKRLADMVNEKKLALVNCSKWKDIHEGPLAQSVRTMSGVAQVQKMLADRGINFFTPIIMQLARQKTYMQCWTAAAEKARMWEEYSLDRDSVRFSTRLGKIGCIAPFHIYKVEYREELSLDEEIAEVLLNLNGVQVISMDQVFRRKLQDYDYEDEIRLMYMHDIMDFTYKEDLPGIKKFSFAHEPNFIESVIVDPRASDDLTMQVEQFCREKNIQFNGRSTLQMN